MEVVENVVETAVDAGHIAGHLVKKFNPVSVLIRCVSSPLRTYLLNKI